MPGETHEEARDRKPEISKAADLHKRICSGADSTARCPISAVVHFEYENDDGSIISYKSEFVEFCNKLSIMGIRQSMCNWATHQPSSKTNAITASRVEL